MISRIKLANFKCFEKADIKCSPLTLLCGINGAGKSTVIQALLLLRQSFESGDLRDSKLNLNGSLIELGTGYDILFENSESDITRIELTDNKNQTIFKSSFDCSGKASKSDQLSFADCPVKQGVYNSWHKTPPLGGKFRYVSAGRIGPQKIYSHSEAFASSGQIGAQGEYSMSYLYTRSNKTLEPDDPRCKGLIKNTIISGVDHWIQEVTPGAHLKIQPIEDVDFVRAGFQFDQPEDVESRVYRATNVGFGLSYVLPVIVSLLSRPGTLCIIENPEAHLHPRGQTKLAELTALAALAGVQVIVETHSDHFLDGVRIAVRNELIEPNQVSIHYFNRDKGKSIVSTPEIDPDGRLSEWPEGFFDQYEQNLAQLLVPKQKF